MQVLAVQTSLCAIASPVSRCRGKVEQECLVLVSVGGQGQGASTGKRAVLMQVRRDFKSLLCLLFV